MKEQKYCIKNQSSFGLLHIFECGQCFRWNRTDHGSYTGVFGNNVLNVKKEDGIIYFQGMCEGNIKEEVERYFDLENNYEVMKSTLSKVDNNLVEAIKYGEGIRILNQDLWEMIISYIISANNNIPRIKGIIERLCENYGEPIIWNNKTFYTFPRPEDLKDVTIEEYRKLGLGFRDKRVYETTQKVLKGQFDLVEIHKKDTKEVKEELLKLSGVGPKVADCILLFSTLKRFEVFPVDVWVRRLMNELYIKKEDETKVNLKQVDLLAKEKFGNLAGIAQQYLYYWKREA